MDSTFTSQKKIRKSLRNRKVNIPILEQKKRQPVQHKTENAKLYVADQKPEFDVATKKPKLDVSGNNTKATPMKCSEANDYIAQTPKIGKKDAVKSKRNIPVNQNVEGIQEPHCSKDSPVIVNCDHNNGGLENDHSEDSTDAEVSDLSDEGEDIMSEIAKSPAEESSDKQESQDTVKAIESDDEEEDCVESVLKEFNKDISGLHSKTNKIEGDLKAIKGILVSRPRQERIRSFSKRLKQKSAFSLLPNFPLRKKSYVRKMEADIQDEDYEDQLITKCASYGGDSVKEIVINIFKKVFSSKLKTKYCWKGSKKVKRKDAFIDFTGIRDVVWSAVKLHFEECTEKMITKEIKLRLNQAQKDYDREIAKRTAAI